MPFPREGLWPEDEGKLAPRWICTDKPHSISVPHILTFPQFTTLETQNSHFPLFCHFFEKLLFFVKMLYEAKF